MTITSSTHDNAPSNQSDSGSALYLYIVSFVAAVGGLLFGFDTGVISGAIPFVTDHFQLSTLQAGFAVSSLMIACTIGATVVGALTDRFGRKKVLIFAALLFTLSALLSAVPRSFGDLIAARFIGGLAVGIASVVSPMYIAEIAPAHIRGRLVALNQLTIVTGILASYFSNWLLVDIGPSNWRWMFAAEAIPAGLFLGALFFVPESPRWLIKQGDTQKALSIFTRVGGSKHAEIQIRDITASVDKEEGTWAELFQPGVRKALIVGILLALFAHITGIDTIIYYGPVIFMESGVQSASSALLASVIIGIVNFVATIIAINYVDKFGRKPLLLIGLTGMGISITFTGFAVQSESVGTIWLLVSILTYVASFCISIGIVIWVYLSEIFPTKIRGRALSIATMVLWLSNVVITQVFPWMLEKIQGNIFYVFTFICLLAFLFVKYMIIETKGRTLEEIEEMWK
ncbi:D-xylose-proton symporter [subsurface metagenome]